MNPVSWRVMEESVTIVQARLRLAAGIQRTACVPYAVVGGNAVAAWVSRVDAMAVRNTRDVDILLRRQDFPAARQALESAGFTYRKIASLGRPGSLDVFLDGPDGNVRDSLHIVWANESVHADSADVSPDPAESEESGGIALISLNALLRMKLTAFRDKDRMHLRDLIDVGLAGRENLPSLPEPLARRLQSLLDHPEG